MPKKILYLQFTNPATLPALQHSSEIFLERGWKVVFIGRRIPSVDTLFFPEHPNLRVKLFDTATQGFKLKIQFLLFCVRSLGFAFWWRPDVLYVSDFWATPIGFFATFIPGIKVIYHEHDSPPIAPGNSFESTLLAFRRRLGERMFLGIHPNRGRANSFHDDTETSKENVVVFNCPRSSETSEKTSAEPSPFTAIYQGNFSPRYLPLTFLDAMAKLPENFHLAILCFITSGNTGYPAEFRKRAKELGVEDRIHFYAPRARKWVLQLTRSSDLGISLMPLRQLEFIEANMVGASNKCFDYLGSGLPILVTELPDWQKTFVDHGCALSCNPEDPNSIYNALRWFLDHPEERKLMGERGRELVIKEWNYDLQFEPVLKKIAA